MAGEFALATGAPIVAADRIQCYLDLAVTSARPPGSTVTKYFLAARQVVDGDFPIDAAADALIRQLEVLAGAHPLVVVEGGSVSLLRHFALRCATLPFRLTTQVLNIPSPSAHVAYLRTRALRMLTSGMLEEFTSAWRHTAQRSFIRSVCGLDALAGWCERAGVDVADLPSLSRDADLLPELADCVAQSHLELGTAQESVFSSLFGRFPLQLGLPPVKTS